MPTVDYDKLEEALMMLDDIGSAEAWIDRKTGKVHVRTDYVDEEDPLPDDIDTSDQYAAIPSSRDLDLGHPLVYRFTEAHMPQEYERMRGIFRKPGAYRRFSDLVASLGLRDKWHAFREEQTEAALRAWCAENGLHLAPRR